MIDRSLFLPPGTLDADFPVPIGEYCSVPSARMAYLLAGLLGEGESVLEIGTGSGYQTAVLAEKFKYVCSIEAWPIAGIEKKLPANVALICGMDGTVYSTGEHYDSLIVTFAVPAICEVWLEQLKTGGILVVPLQVGNSCRISVYKKLPDETLQLEDVCGYANFTQSVTVQ